jgi:predicted Zn-dependent protease
MIQARHYADAGQNCRRLLQQHPDDTRLRYFLAECCHSEGRDEEAGALLDAVLKEDPNYTDALILGAVLSCDAGQDEEAVPLLRRVKDREPLRSVPRYYLSLALARTGHVEEAENEMAEAQQLLKAERVIEDAEVQPEDLDLRVEAAKLLIERGRADEAAPLLGDVLTRRPLYEPAMRVLFSKELANYGQARGNR